MDISNPSPSSMLLSMKTLITISLIFSAFNFTYAGSERGGGSVVVCYKKPNPIGDFTPWADNSKKKMKKIERAIENNEIPPLYYSSIKSVIATDIYPIVAREGNQSDSIYNYWNGFVDSSENSTTSPANQIVGNIISRLLEKNSQVGEILNNAYQNNLVTYGVVGVQPENDAEINFTPEKYCYLYYVAINEALPGGTNRILINSGLFGLMDTVNQASILLHEVVLSRNADLSLSTTSSVQEIVRLLMNPESSLWSMNGEEIDELLTGLGTE